MTSTPAALTATQQARPAATITPIPWGWCDQHMHHAYSQRNARS